MESAEQRSRQSHVAKPLATRSCPPPCREVGAISAFTCVFDALWRRGWGSLLETPCERVATPTPDLKMSEPRQAGVRLGRGAHRVCGPFFRSTRGKTPGLRQRSI